MIEFFVAGKPEPAGSKRAFALKKGGQYTGRVAVLDDNPKSKGWQSLVRDAAVESMKGIGLMKGPLSLTVEFNMPRPKAHHRANGNLRPDAPVWHQSKPDATKLVRGIEDALTGIVWKDDAQVASQWITKSYGGTLGCKITVRFLEGAAFFQAQEAA